MAMANDRVHPRKRKKVCSFCVDKVAHIDFKDTAKLRRYLSERGKILPRRTTGTCAAHHNEHCGAAARLHELHRLNLCIRAARRGAQRKVPCRSRQRFRRATQ